MLWQLKSYSRFPVDLNTKSGSTCYGRTQPHLAPHSAWTAREGCFSAIRWSRFEEARGRAGSGKRRLRRSLSFRRVGSSTIRFAEPAWSRIWSSCAPQGLRILLCAPLYAVDNIGAPRFTLGLLTEGL